MSNVIAIIPARGGSKGVPGKNIMPLKGHPVVAYSIAAALNSKSVSRTIVTTDSEEIAEIAKNYGAEVPFMRPAEFATDTATDRGYLLHAVNWLKENESYNAEYIVHLRPTTPLRDPAVIDQAVKAIKENSQATSLRSAHVSPQTPFKMFEIDENGFFKGLFPNDPRPEYYNLPRQSFPPIYDPNGYVDVLRSAQLTSSESPHGKNILGFINEYTYEIDTIEELNYIKYLIEEYGSPLLPFLDQAIRQSAKEQTEK